MGADVSAAAGVLAASASLAHGSLPGGGGGKGGGAAGLGDAAAAAALSVVAAVRLGSTLALLDTDLGLDLSGLDLAGPHQDPSLGRVEPPLPSAGAAVLAVEAAAATAAAGQGQQPPMPPAQGGGPPLWGAELAPLPVVLRLHPPCAPLLPRRHDTGNSGHAGGRRSREGRMAGGPLEGCDAEVTLLLTAALPPPALRAATAAAAVTRTSAALPPARVRVLVTQGGRVLHDATEDLEVGGKGAEAARRGKGRRGPPGRTAGVRRGRACLRPPPPCAGAAGGLVALRRQQQQQQQQQQQK